MPTLQPPPPSIPYLLFGQGVAEACDGLFEADREDAFLAWMVNDVEKESGDEREVSHARVSIGMMRVAVKCGSGAPLWSLRGVAEPFACKVQRNSGGMNEKKAVAASLDACESN